MNRKRIYAMHYGNEPDSAWPVWTIYRQDKTGRATVNRYPVVKEWHIQLLDALIASERHGRLLDRLKARYAWEYNPNAGTWKIEPLRRPPYFPLA